jgi:hypothetical protein
VPQFKYVASGSYVIASDGTGVGPVGYQVSVTSRGWSGSVVFAQNIAPPGSVPNYVNVAYQDADTGTELAAGTAITGTAAVIISPTVGDLIAIVTVTTGEVIINVNPATQGVTNRELRNAFVAAGYDTAGQDTTEAMLSVAVAGMLGQVLDVRAFGATGDGVTDDTLAIQAAIDACFDAGGGTVFCPAGTYLLNFQVNPRATVTGIAPCLMMRSGVTLAGAGTTSTTFLLAPNAAIPPGLPGVLPQIHILSTWYAYTAVLANTQSNIAYRDFTLNGNAANQSFDLSAYFHVGLFTGSTRGMWCDRVIVKNVYGTDDAPPGESFHFEFNSSVDGHYTDCHAFCDDGGDTATGFSANASTSCEWKGCTAYGMTYGMGFTHAISSLMRYTNCHAYLNGRHGFNTEVSRHVAYSSCQSGGVAALYDFSAFYTSEQVIGNTDAGWKLLGSQNVTLASCQSEGNAEGLRISSSTTPVARASTTVSVVSSLFTANTGDGVVVDASQALVSIDPSTRAISNGANDYTLATGTTDVMTRAAFNPIDTYFNDGGNSGVRWNQTGTTPSLSAYRFQVNDVTQAGVWIDGSVFALNAFVVTDGVAAPATRSGFASIYVDTADGDLKIRFGDGTIKTIVTDT